MLTDGWEGERQRTSTSLACFRENNQPDTAKGGGGSTWDSQGEREAHEKKFNEKLGGWVTPQFLAICKPNAVCEIGTRTKRNKQEGPRPFVTANRRGGPKESDGVRGQGEENTGKGKNTSRGTKKKRDRQRGKIGAPGWERIAVDYDSGRESTVEKRKFKRGRRRKNRTRKVRNCREWSRRGM